MKKTLSMILALVMMLGVFTGLSIPASAAEKDIAPTGDNPHGTTGDCLWEYIPDSNALHIYGSGRMADYSTGYDTPWYDAVGEDGAYYLYIDFNVSYIGAYAFANTNVGVVDFAHRDNVADDRENPCALTEIGDCAFYGCWNLEAFHAPSGLKTIGSFAFANCSSLYDVRLNWGLTTVGSVAFYNDEELSSVAVPTTVTSIGEAAFGMLKSDQEGVIYEPIENFSLLCGFSTCGSAYASENHLHTETLYDYYSDGARSHYNVSDHSLVVSSVDGGSVWLEHADEIYYAYWGEIESIYVYNGITYVGENAFSNLLNVESVYLQGDLESIGPRAFSGCRNLTLFHQIQLADSALVTIGEEAFFDTGLEDVTIYSGVISIGINAFGYHYTGANTVPLADHNFTFYCPNDNAAAKAYCNVNDMIYVYQTEAPIITMIKNTTTGISLTWDPVDHVKCYAVYRDVKDNPLAVQLVGYADTTSYTVTNGLTGGERYTFYVQCYSDDHYAPLSDASDGKTITYLKTPHIKSIQNVYGGQKVLWDTVNGAVEFKVYTWEGSYWKPQATTVYTDYTYQPLTNKKSYTYTVVAYAEDGSTSSYEKNVSKVYLQAPSITSLTNINNGVRAQWTATPGATKYALFHRIGKNAVGWTKVGTFTGTTGDDTTLKTNYDGQEVYFTVRAIGSDGQYLTGYHPTGWKKIYIVSPYAMTIIDKVDAVYLTWSSGKTAKKFLVYRRLESEKKWHLIATTTARSYTDTKDLASGTQYRYTVVAYDAKGNQSGYYSPGWAKLYIQAPKIKSSGNITSGIRTTWVKSKGAKYYVIFRRSKKVRGWSSWEPIRTVNNTYSMYTDTTAKKGVTYQYTVRCADYKTDRGTKKLYYTSAFRSNAPAVKRNR